MAREDSGPPVTPIEDALGYEMTDDQGNIVFSMITAYQIDKKSGNFKAWVSHPKYGTQVMDPSQGGYISKSKAIVVVRKDAFDSLVALVQTLTERLDVLEVQVEELTPIAITPVKANGAAPTAKA